MPLTKRQKEILDYIESFIEEQGYAPSFEEIAESFGYSSLATVHEHLSNLERKGYIRKSYNESRSIELVGHDLGLDHQIGNIDWLVGDKARQDIAHLDHAQHPVGRPFGHGQQRVRAGVEHRAHCRLVRRDGPAD